MKRIGMLTSGGDCQALNAAMRGVVTVSYTHLDVYKRQGMTCSACSSHVEKSVGKLTGVENVSVNLLTNSMQVEFDENKLDTAGIIKAVEDAGYGAAVKDEHAKSGAKTSGQSGSQENNGLSAVEQNVKNMKKRLIVSLIFWIPLMYVRCV